MTTCNFTTDELMTVRIALARYEAFYIAERETWTALADEDGTWTDADRERFLSNAHHCNKLASDAAQLLNAPSSPLNV